LEVEWGLRADEYGRWCLWQLWQARPDETDFFIWQRFARNIYPLKRNNILSSIIIETKTETVLAEAQCESYQKTLRLKCREIRGWSSQEGGERSD